MSNLKQELIHFKEHKKSDASVVLEIELNNPQKLNVLNLEMIFALNKKIKEWRDRADLSAVFIHSAGEKAFCAGGDVAQVYFSILKSKKEGRDPAEAVKDFFQTEYEADYMLSQLSQPVVLWGDGIVMGGGMGLFMASSHPLVTEASRLAMPEVSIGFFPDVGASYFLSRVKENMGRYLALTACQLNAKEACFLNMAQWAFLREDKQNVFDFLLESSFKNKEEFNIQFRSFYREPRFLSQQDCWIKNFQKDILKALGREDLTGFYNYLLKAEREDQKWERNRRNFLKASPTSLAVSLELLKKAQSQDLKSIYEMDLTIAMNKARQADFPEGVRALLIDKTKNPQWNPSRIEGLKQTEIDQYFMPSAGWDSSLRV